MKVICEKRRRVSGKWGKCGKSPSFVRISRKMCFFASSCSCSRLLSAAAAYSQVEHRNKLQLRVSRLSFLFQMKLWCFPFFRVHARREKYLKQNKIITELTLVGHQIEAFVGSSLELHSYSREKSRFRLSQQCSKALESARKTENECVVIYTLDSRTQQSI